MTPWKTRGVGFGLLAGACACLNAAPAWADDTTDYTALVLGHALLPQPDPTYMQEVIDTYVDPTPTTSAANRSTTSSATPSACTRPRPITIRGSPRASLTWTQRSTATAANPDANLVIAGYSMSTSIQTQEMINLAATAGGVPDTSGLKFVLAEDLQQPRRRNLHPLARICSARPFRRLRRTPRTHRHLQHRVQRSVRLPAVLPTTSTRTSTPRTAISTCTPTC